VVIAPLAADARERRTKPPLPAMRSCTTEFLQLFGNLVNIDDASRFPSRPEYYHLRRASDLHQKQCRLPTL
jgi:hypothetical protein